MTATFSLKQGKQEQAVDPFLTQEEEEEIIYITLVLGRRVATILKQFLPRCSKKKKKKKTQPRDKIGPCTFKLIFCLHFSEKYANQSPLPAVG